MFGKNAITPLRHRKSGGEWDWGGRKGKMRKEMEDVSANGGWGWERWRMMMGDDRGAENERWVPKN
jgi:hypothetical protein